MVSLAKGQTRGLGAVQQTLSRFLTFCAASAYLAFKGRHTCRYSVAHWQAHPWYAEGPFKDIFGPGAWLRWVRGCAPPERRHKKFLPEGYRLREVGPPQQGTKGEIEMDQTIEALKAKNPGSCPFASL